MKSFLQGLFGKFFPLVMSASRHFVTAFVATFVPLATGIWLAPNLSTATALGSAAFVAALAAGVRAVVSALTSGQLPFPNFGL